MDIRKINEIAYNLININQTDFSIRDDKEKLLYVLAYNDGVVALADSLKKELENENQEDAKTDDLQA